jgi:hypothetical protein
MSMQTIVLVATTDSHDATADDMTAINIAITGHPQGMPLHLVITGHLQQVHLHLAITGHPQGMPLHLAPLAPLVQAIPHAPGIIEGIQTGLRVLTGLAGIAGLTGLTGTPVGIQSGGRVLTDLIGVTDMRVLRGLTGLIDLRGLIGPIGLTGLIDLTHPTGLIVLAPALHVQDSGVIQGLMSGIATGAMIIEIIEAIETIGTTKTIEAIEATETIGTIEIIEPTNTGTIVIGNHANLSGILALNAVLGRAGVHIGSERSMVKHHIDRSGGVQGRKEITHLAGKISTGVLLSVLLKTSSSKVITSGSIATMGMSEKKSQHHARMHNSGQKLRRRLMHWSNRLLHRLPGRSLMGSLVTRRRILQERKRTRTKAEKRLVQVVQHVAGSRVGKERKQLVQILVN